MRVRSASQIARSDGPPVRSIGSESKVKRPPLNPKRGRGRRAPAADGDVISQQRRKIIGDVFGWAMTAGLLDQLRHHGLVTVDRVLTFTLNCFNPVRLRTVTAGRQPA